MLVWRRWDSNPHWDPFEGRRCSAHLPALTSMNSSASGRTKPSSARIWHSMASSAWEPDRRLTTADRDLLLTYCWRLRRVLPGGGDLLAARVEPCLWVP